MPAARFVKALSAVALFNGVLYFSLVPETVARRFAQLYPDGRPGTPENPQE